MFKKDNVANKLETLVFGDELKWVQPLDNAYVYLADQ